MKDKAIVIFLTDDGVKRDLEVPLNITAAELINALNIAYNLCLDTTEVRNCYLKSEQPIALLRGNQTLAECGVRTGTIIHF